MDGDLDLPDLRVVIVSESNSGNRSLLFDSKATTRFFAPLNDPPYECIFEDIGYKVKHPWHQDVNKLSDMMLGTMPLTRQNASLKVGEFF